MCGSGFWTILPPNSHSSRRVDFPGFASWNGAYTVRTLEAVSGLQEPSEELNEPWQMETLSTVTVGRGHSTTASPATSSKGSTTARIHRRFGLGGRTCAYWTPALTAPAS